MCPSFACLHCIKTTETIIKQSLFYDKLYGLNFSHFKDLDEIPMGSLPVWK